MSRDSDSYALANSGSKCQEILILLLLQCQENQCQEILILLLLQFQDLNMSRDDSCSSSALAEVSHGSMPKKELQQQPKIHPGAKKSVIFYRKSEAKSSKGYKTGQKKPIVQHQQNYETL
jgi:hypothetical protein